MNSTVQTERIKKLNDQNITPGDYVLYWMQASQRTLYNHTLEYAIYQANKIGKPLIVYFGLTDEYPEANQRHYYFMLQGLIEVEKSLQDKNIQLVVLNRSPEIGAMEMAESASLVVTDRGYLINQREWRHKLASEIECPLIQVESEVVVPVETASDKEEYSAATIRKKISRNLKRFMVPLKSQNPLKSSLNMDFSSISLENIKNLVASLKIDKSVQEVSHYCGGTSEALKHLDNFLTNKLDKYGELRNDPAQDYTSHMSPYLHFGQISPLYIALLLSATESPGRDDYLEELIVRRELSMNFVFYNPHYHNLHCLPHWALKTLAEHEQDKREYIYSREELEGAQTHDPYWNSAQREMLYLGKMQGYMRMYWGKKILEWTQDPREAFKTALYLNNKYEIDGRDANGFTGVAWCFGKHDRAWKEREIFGKVRYMNANGLLRKFKINLYVDRIDSLRI